MINYSHGPEYNNNLIILIVGTYKMKKKNAEIDLGMNKIIYLDSRYIIYIVLNNVHIILLKCTLN